MRERLPPDSLQEQPNRYIDVFVASHLVYKLPPFGYGKDVLRGKFKPYLCDPAIAPAVMLRDKSMIADAQLLGSKGSMCRGNNSLRFESKVIGQISMG